MKASRSELKRIIFDSSAWIEFLNAEPVHTELQRLLDQATAVIVPSIIQFEVYKKILQKTSEDYALSAITAMTSSPRHSSVELSSSITLYAADLSIKHKLGMADSLVLAHALVSNSILVTYDHDFHGIDSVLLLRK